MRSLDFVWQLLGNPDPATREALQLGAIVIGALASTATIIGSIYAFVRWMIRKIKGKPTARSPRNRELVQKLRRRGWADYKAGRYGPAIVAFDEAIRLHPNSGDAYKGRSFCHLAVGELEFALSDLNEAAAILPEDHAIFFCRARVFWQLRMLDDATADLRRVLLLRPGHADAESGLRQVAAANDSVRDRVHRIPASAELASQRVA
jgi:tetratricopeptide (TPR) repeat protein